jgi:hypothetical protein
MSKILPPSGLMLYSWLRKTTFGIKKCQVLNHHPQDIQLQIQTLNVGVLGAWSHNISTS